MTHRYIHNAPGLPPSPSPISHAVVAGDHCYISGQLATDGSGEFRPGTAQEEAEQAFRNVFAALDAAGFAREDIVYIDIAFMDLNDLADVNQLYTQLFPERRRPARTVYQAAALPYGGRVKVQAIAVGRRAS